MIKRKTLRLIIGLAVLLGGVGLSAPAAHADPGTGYTYICNQTGYYGDYVIQFKYLYKCSNGPMDYTSISQISNYTGKQVHWIGGECAWHAWYRLGWRDMTKIWNWCLTNPRFVPS